MYNALLKTHYIVVTLFLLIYVVKTILLLSNKNDVLAAFSKKVKVPEMIVSTLFLLTGIYLATQLSFNGKYTYLFWIKIAMVVVSIPVAIVGFKKSNKILAALSLLLITGSFGIAESFHKKKGIAKDEVVVSGNDGAQLYQANCALCHGGDGKLGMSGAADLTATTLDKEGIKNIILNGKGAMVPVQMNAEQADAVAAYVEANIKGR